MIEEHGGIEPAAFELHLEVQVLGGGAAGTAGEPNDLPGFHLVARLDQVLALVAVEWLQTGSASSIKLSVFFMRDCGIFGVIFYILLQDLPSS